MSDLDPGRDTDLARRVDAWLDADLGALDDARPDGETVARVTAARERGRRLRARRRLLAGGGVTAAVAAAVAGMLALGGGFGSLTTVPQPPSSPSDRPTGGTSDEPTGPRPSGLRADGTAGPIDVGYPVDGGAGRVAVTWPAPANGLPWRVDGVESFDTADETGKALATAVFTAVGALPSPPDRGIGIVTVGLDGVANTYSMDLETDVTGGTALVHVVVSRGGGFVAGGDPGRGIDDCGWWPADVPGLGGQEVAHPERCTLADLPGTSLTLVHREEPAVGAVGRARSVFTVRPDGVMVLISWTLLQPSSSLPAWRTLDQAVADLEWPQTGADRPMPVDVAYPSGSGTRTVTWPAPSNGLLWRVRDVDVLPTDAAAVGFRDAVAPALGAQPGDAGRVSVWGVRGVPTSYVMSFDVPVGSGSASATLLVSRGGLPDDGVPFDRCGAWPSGVAGLGGRTPGPAGRCELVEEPAADGPTYLVHGTTPASGDVGTRRSVFTVRPDGTAVSLTFTGVPGDARWPGWDALDRVVRELTWPAPAGGGAVAPVEVRYAVTGGKARTVRWPAPASGRVWSADDPSVVVGGPAGAVTAGARDLQRALTDRVPGASTTTPAEGDGPQVIGTVDGRATAYLARVSVPGAGVVPSKRTTWTVRATRGGLTVRPAGFDLCGDWPSDLPGLGMTADERSVWFEDSGRPRRCSVTVVDGVTVVDVTVASGRPGPDQPPAPAQAYSFTVRPNGTAFAAGVSAPVGKDPADYLDRLHRLVLDLPYPSRS